MGTGQKHQRTQILRAMRGGQNQKGCRRGRGSGKDSSRPTYLLPEGRRPLINVPGEFNPPIDGPEVHRKEKGGVSGGKEADPFT